MVEMISFKPFLRAEDALANINDVSEGIVNGTQCSIVLCFSKQHCLLKSVDLIGFCYLDTLKDFIEVNLPKAKKGKVEIVRVFFLQ
jgi:hypothetical protein